VNKKYNGKQLKFLRMNYANMLFKTLMAEFNEKFRVEKTKAQIKRILSIHNIKSGRTGRFKKGHKTWNADTKGLLHANKTSFKKGNIPGNIKPLGFERISKDGYIEIKIAERNPYTGFPTRFKNKHVYLWEKAFGPVPRGSCIAFKDGNPFNCVLDNFMLVSRIELLNLNRYGYKGIPDKIKPSILILSKLQARISEAGKGGDG